MILSLPALGAEYAINDKKLKESHDEFEDLLDKFSATKITFIAEDILQV